MYQFVDRPLVRLGSGSRFVLWAMRAWMNAARRDRCPRATIAGAFANMGAEAALPDFQDAMRYLRAAACDLRVAPLACKRIAEGEAVLLALWHDAASGGHDRARALLRLIVPAATADLVAESLAGAAHHLRHAGLAPEGLAATPASDIGGEEC